MQEFITHFGIDWKLLTAQVVNFAILLFLLKRFVYAPVLEVLKKRKARIEEGLQFAKDAEEELRRTEALREDVLESAKKEAHGIVMSAEDQAKRKEADALLSTARKTESAIAEAKRIIQDEKKKMQNEFQGEAEELVLAGITKVLGSTPPEVRDTPLIADAVKELKAITFKQK